MKRTILHLNCLRLRPKNWRFYLRGIGREIPILIGIVMLCTK